MRFPYFGGAPKTPAENMQLRSQVADFVRQRGSAKPPNPPRDVILQSGPRGVFAVWSLPSGAATDIAGWRIYRDNESTLLDKIPDRGTRQYLIPASAGSTPPTVNVFISSVNALGVESTKVQAQGKATTEAAAPSLPSAPAGYSQGGGSDITGGIGSRNIGNGGSGQNQ